jgi:hypothetical protein
MKNYNKINVYWIFLKYRKVLSDKRFVSRKDRDNKPNKNAIIKI